MALTRDFLHIDLKNQAVARVPLSGVDLVRAGRYLIAKTMVEQNLAAVDPLGPENPLIFSCGPFAGTPFSNANRISVGCKSPLTGGIKEANGGGTLAYALGRLNLAGFTLHSQGEGWSVLHFDKSGHISFDDAAPYLGLKNFEAAERLKEHYGRKIAIGLCGPVGEYLGMVAGIAFTDSDGRPSRLAARGGVGAVMGSKRVKAIVVELDTMPRLHDRKKTIGAMRKYAEKLGDGEVIQSTYRSVGTMATADLTNHLGGMPNRNFTGGSMPSDENGSFTMGGTYIRELNLSRGGIHAHACMPGCVIQCSNVYVDEKGQEITSPVEYETLSLLGTNCGISNPDHLAEMNQWCNELGIDTIETGAMIAVLMDVGEGAFGDLDFMRGVFKELLAGSERGRFYAKGTAHVGEQLGILRVPVIKRQAISAYDPRVIEVTGLSMMATAQGADHTVGNVPGMKTADKELSELIEASLAAQIASAAVDSIGLCIFGRSVTNPNIDFLADSINAALGTDLKPTFFHEIGREVLRLERSFNEAAGFTEADDELPTFFYDEPLDPTGRTARFHAADVHSMYTDHMDSAGTEGVPDRFGRLGSTAGENQASD